MKDSQEKKFKSYKVELLDCQCSPKLLKHYPTMVNYSYDMAHLLGGECEPSIMVLPEVGLNILFKDCSIGLMFQNNSVSGYITGTVTSEAYKEIKRYFNPKTSSVVSLESFKKHDKRKMKIL